MQNGMEQTQRTEGQVRIAVDVLKAKVREQLVANQVPAEQAQVVADCFVEADACGVSTHGVAVLPTHINKIQKGGYNLSPSLEVLREAAGFAVIDADNGIGAVTGVHCMNYAMEKAKSAGVFTVLSRNSNTYGPAFYYPLLAAQQGLIGITFSNSPAAMPAWGGKETLFGTNPFAIAVPCQEGTPVIFDMATSKVAKSKINEARKNNQTIPLGWALDAEGQPTTDPLEAIKGLVLPMAEHKGSGLAMTIDILSGVLAGAAFLNHVGKFYSEDNKCMNAGQTFIAIDPLQVHGEDFYEVMDAYTQAIRASRSLTDETVRVPGDNKMKRKNESLANGIVFDTKTVDWLTDDAMV